MAFLEDWVRQTTELESTTKLFVYALAEFADNQTGECWPSQPTIATAMSMSTSTVQRELKRCLELKLVEVRRRWHRSNVYRLLCIKKPELSTMTSSSEVREQPPPLNTNVGTAVNNPPKQRWVSPQEIGVLLEDIGDTLGHRLLEQKQRLLRANNPFC